MAYTCSGKEQLSVEPSFGQYLHDTEDPCLFSVPEHVAVSVITIAYMCLSSACVHIMGHATIATLLLYRGFIMYYLLAERKVEKRSTEPPWLYSQTLNK